MTLSPEEIALATEVAFDPAVLVALKTVTGHSPQRSIRWEYDRERSIGNELKLIAVLIDAIFVPIEQKDLEDFLPSIRKQVQPLGYLPFWTVGKQANGLTGSDEITLLRTKDELDILRLKQTTGANYEVYEDMIIDHISSWKELCQFNIAGAGHDFVAIDFDTLPENLCGFAADVYKFCPDTIEQSAIGLTTPSEADMAAAHEICPGPGQIATKSIQSIGTDTILENLPPDMQRLMAMSADGQRLMENMKQMLSKLKTGGEEISFTEPDENLKIKLLALAITRTKSLYLWWD